MKRRDLMKRIVSHANSRGLTYTVIEGSRHTKVKIGDKQTVIPRHNEINERTARSILRQIGVEQ